MNTSSNSQSAFFTPAQLDYTDLIDFVSNHPSARALIVTGKSGAGKTGFLQLVAGIIESHVRFLHIRSQHDGIAMCDGDAFGYNDDNGGWSTDLSLLREKVIEAKEARLFLVIGFISDNFQEAVDVVNQILGVTPIVVIKRDIPWYQAVYKARQQEKHSFFQKFLDGDPEVLASYNEYVEPATWADNPNPVLIKDLYDVRFPSEQGRGSWFNIAIANSTNGVLDIRISPHSGSRVSVRNMYGAFTLVSAYIEERGGSAVSRNIYVGIRPVKITAGWRSDPAQAHITLLSDVISRFVRNRRSAQLVFEKRLATVSVINQYKS